MKKLCEDAAMAMYREGRLDQEIAEAIGYSCVAVTNWRNNLGLPPNRGQKPKKMLDAYKAAMPLERVQELAQAEKDGRLAILPCQIGAPVWWITLSWVEKTVTVRYTIESGKFRYAMLDWQNPVYTSQAAAEAALAEMAKEGTTSEKSHSD